MWYGHKPNVSHFKTFSVMCYVKILDEKKSKLDLKLVLGILISYSDVSKGYRIYDVKAKKIFINKDVRFGEGRF